MIDDVQLVHRLLGYLGYEVSEISYLSAGVASQAWLAHGTNLALVVRFVPSESTRSVTYASEHLLLRHLAADSRFPTPIATVMDYPQVSFPVWKGWSVTTKVPGTPVGSRMSLDVAYEVGALLSRIHGIPSSGFGPLAQRSDQIIGVAGDHITGVRQRWSSGAFWPFARTKGGLRYVDERNRSLSQHIEGLELRVTSALSNAPSRVVVNHGDLHGEHIFESGNHLTGVIDFGGAFVGNAAWDFAILSYFHGRSAVRAALDGYYDRGGTTMSEMDIDLFLIAFALYRLDVDMAQSCSELLAAHSLTTLERAVQELEA